MAQFGEELAFLKTQALALQNIPVTFDNDYQPALADVPKRVLPFQVSLAVVSMLITILPPPTKPQPPKTIQTDPSSSTGHRASLSRGGVTLIIKSTKPSLSFTLQAHPTDTIAQIKAQLAKEHLRAPVSDDQRLLLKGKVLADAKLLKEYPISSDSTTNITLMTKQGSTWTGEERTATTSPGITVDGVPAGGEVVVAEPETIVQPTPKNLARPSGGHGHARSMSGAADEMPVPSVTLSPTPDPSTQGHPAMHLDMDLNMIADPPRAMTPTAEGFHHVISDPSFWQSLMQFLKGQFKTPDDAQIAWEDFFLASKNHLSPNEIAKIRDVTGAVAMAGI
ncbi:hypothetical protein FRB98_006852 [Tulasnella sp. 332]|nr:hypothetical protein FRB98_006852 [Tulasnella sp. 332]